MFIDSEQAQIIKTGAAGVTAGVGAAGVSMLEVVEQWLRVGSLIVGITVGILTAISIILKLVKRK